MSEGKTGLPIGGSETKRYDITEADGTLQALERRGS